MEASTSKHVDTSRVKIKEKPVEDRVESKKPKSKRKKKLPRFECKKKYAPRRVVNEAWLASNEKYLQRKAEKDSKRKKKREEKKSPGRWTRSDETKLLAEKHKRIKEQQANTQQKRKNKDKGKEDVVDVEEESEMNERLKKQKWKKKKNPKERKREGRATLRPLFEALCGLSPQRKRVVTKIGFGNLIDFSIVEIPTKLAFYVVDILNTMRMTLECPLGDIVITQKTVKEVLGLLLGRRKLEREGQIEYNDPFLLEWKD
ncbi:hypothetical protein Tco_0536463 [Tanacetum coccineum]